jgi:uncharacterized protein involved in response to NO
LISQALWLRGFRPFFLGASVFAILAMAMWLLLYGFGLRLDLDGISIFQWHAHEMLYGYALAVIAGFLLTAAWTWTGEKTASGAGLVLIFAFWVLARALMANGTGLLIYAAAADLAFMIGLGIAVARPIIKVRQKRQMPVLLIIALLAAANLMFYLGAAGVLDQGVRLGIYSGLYLVLGMVLFMGRRVVPFFTERGVDYPVELKNARWNDIATSILFPAFLISEVFFQGHVAGALLAAALFLSNSVRVLGWHTTGVWKKPLLWGLFAAFIMINLGFLLRALIAVTAISDFLPIHAFAVGGIGIVTMSMMARVTLGHTGRSVHQAPPVMGFLLALMVLTTAVRVFFPMLDPGRYTLWITASGIIWIITFSLFSVIFIPMLSRQRVDDRAKP